MGTAWSVAVDSWLVSVVVGVLLTCTSTMARGSLTLRFGKKSLYDRSSLGLLKVLLPLVNSVVKDDNAVVVVVASRSVMVLVESCRPRKRCFLAGLPRRPPLMRAPEGIFEQSRT